VFSLFVTSIFLKNLPPSQSLGIQKRVKVAAADTIMGRVRDRALSLSTVNEKSARVLELMI
jgi:hypothetical protein